MMQLFLGTQDDFQSFGFPGDEHWTVEVAAEAAVSLWQGEDPPEWVASTDAALAQAVAAAFGGVSVQDPPEITVVG